MEPSSGLSMNSLYSSSPSDCPSHSRNWAALSEALLSGRCFRFENIHIDYTTATLPVRQADLSILISGFPSPCFILPNSEVTQPQPQHTPLMLPWRDCRVLPLPALVPLDPALTACCPPTPSIEEIMEGRVLCLLVSF